jgi:hypothetical protein
MSLNSTQLFIEQLLSGFLTLIAIALIFASIFDLNFGDISSYSDYEGIIFLLIVACSYPLGIFSDNLADEILKKWEKRIKLKAHFGNPQGQTDLEMEISIGEILRVADSEWLSLYYTYSRKRIRVSRSAAFNILLLTPSIIAFLIGNNDFGPAWKISLGVFIIGMVLFSIAIWNWFNLTKDFYRKSKRTWEKMVDQKIEENKDSKS